MQVMLLRSEYVSTLMCRPGSCKSKKGHDLLLIWPVTCNCQMLITVSYKCIHLKKSLFIWRSYAKLWANPQAPVAQKIADEVVFWHLLGEGDPQSDFWCASLRNYRFKPFQISFFSGFHIKMMFWVRWFNSLFERMRLKRRRTMFIHTNQFLIT